MPDHSQLKTYQVAVAKWEGLKTPGTSASSRTTENSTADNRLNGAELIFLKHPNTVRKQDPLTDESVNAWVQKLIEVAIVIAGPQFASRSDLETDENPRSGSLGRVLVGKSALDSTFTPSTPGDGD